MKPNGRPLVDRFSARERAVFDQAIDGERVADIARRLRIHPSTVRVYLGRIFRAFKVKTHLKLVVAYWRDGIGRSA